MILDDLRAELTKYRSRKYRINAQRFYKERLEQVWVLKGPVARAISKDFYDRIKRLPKKDIIALCNELLASGIESRRFFAFEWAFGQKAKFTPSDFRTFELWLKNYVDSWSSCDHLCTSPLGEIVAQYPELTARVLKWTGSKSRWLRRAAAVTMIPSARRRQGLDTVFVIADRLLLDSDDMVQKGYGWMLKEAGNVFPDEVFGYVMKNKERMPRTALRYAIEKYPPAKKKLAMSRG